MKRAQKNIILISVLFIIILTIMSTKVFAAGIGVGINKTSGYVGDTFNVTISGIYGKVSISSNSNVSLNISGTQFIENGSITVTGTAKSVGTGTITVTPIDAVTTGANPKEVTTPSSASITIKKKETPKPSTSTKKPVVTKPTTTTKTQKVTSSNKKEEKKDDFYITKLTLKGVKENEEKVDIELSPKFSKNVYEYSCKVESDIQKIELAKDAGDYTKYITVEGLEELKEGENTIKLKLATDGQKTKTYTIKVTKEVATVETSNEPQTADNTIIESNEPQNEKEPITVSMSLGAFIALEAGIIIAEAIIFCVAFRKKLFRRNH